MTIQNPIKSDLPRIDAMNDSDIDYSDIPEFDETFLHTINMNLSQTNEKLKEHYVA